MKIDKKYMCSALFITALVLSNILAVKVINLGSMVFTGGVLCYAITYLMTDVVGELYGKAEANKLVVLGLVCQFVATLLIGLTLALPTNNSQAGEQFQAVLGISGWFLLASLVAYGISQTLDVIVFHKMRTLLIEQGKNHRWIWNNIATIVSQFVDTVVFMLIAFGLGQRFLFETNSVILLFEMIGWQYLIKVILAVADTPMFYILTKNKS